MITNEQLTPEALAELNALTKGNNAFDLLVKNFNANGEGEISYKDVVSRLQAQYFALSRAEDALKTVASWNQNEYNEPHEINVAIPAVVAGKYSSFALKDVHEDYELNYPLDNDYALAGMPFASTDISATQVGLAFRQLSQKFGLTVNESTVASTSTYKTPNKILSGAVLKIKNLFLKLAKKPELKSNIFKGKITLQTRVGGYNVSNVEKVVKAYDMVLKKSIERDAKQIKKHTKKAVSPEVKYASRLFADVLMTRINDLGNIKNNQIAEQSLWLQFSGVLNRYAFGAQDLSQITELGSMAVANTCLDLGITKEKVVERMTRLGFTYSAVPTDIAQALLNVKERDYAKYNQTAEAQADATFGIASANTLPKDQTKTDTQAQPNEKPEDKKVDNNTTSTALIESSRELTDSQNQTQNIKATTVEKNVDKLIVKFLANVTTQLAEKVDGGKLKGKKLEKTNAQLRLYNLTLAYYVQATHGKPMAVKGEYTESEISRAKQIVTGLLKQKTQVAEMISTSNVERVEGQTSTSYMNAVCKQNLNHTLRDYFLKLIKGCVDYCINQQFGGKAQNTGDENINEEIASLVADTGVKYTDYVPDFVIVDEGTETTSAKDTKTDDLEEVATEPEQLEMDLGLEKPAPQPTYEQLELDLQLADKNADSTNSQTDDKDKKTDYVPNFVFVNDPKDPTDGGRE